MEENKRTHKDYDDLTGLYTQKAFYRRLAERFASDIQATYYLIYMDIERFKLLNDLYGMEEGDKLLCWFGSQLDREAELRGGLACRFRADNFALCAPYEEEELRYVLWMLHNEARNYPLDFEVVLNMGIYPVYDPSVSLSLMCDRAAMAAHSIKGNALAYFAYYDENMRDDLIKEQEMVRDMRIALEQHQFEVYAQPKFNHANGKLIGLEALVRWEHPDKGIISPGYFIPVFEHNNFIQEVDRYVWESVCRRIHDWTAMGNRPVPISVNVSRINLYNPYLCELLDGLCDTYQVDKSLLQLEITESAFIEDTELIVDAVKRLRGAGFEVHLDDFGSGFSSFHILKELDVDLIKVDMKFLMGNYREGKGKVILESIVKMAGGLEIPVLAEGVENREQADFLLRIGCPYVQGFYYSPPVPRAEIEKQLDRYLREGRVQFALDGRGKEEESDLAFHSVIYQELLKKIPGAAGLYEIEEDRIITLLNNSQAVSMTGYTKKEYDEKWKPDLYRLILSDDYAKTRKAVTESVRENRLLNTSLRILKKDGKIAWINVWANPVGRREGYPVYLAMFSDCTEEKRIAAQLEKARKYQKRMKSDSIASMEIDLTGNRVISSDDPGFCSTASCENGGHEELTYSGYIRSMAKWIYGEEREEFTGALNRETLLKAYFKGERMVKQEYRMMNSLAGRYSYVQLSVYFISNTVNGHVYADIFIHDITAQKQKEIELLKKAETDPLTGLYNRGAMEQKIRTYLYKNRKNRQICGAFFMIDVDNFKNINDSMGHRCGDRALIQVGERLKGLFRKSDFCGRMGGDEFVVFMTGVDSKDAVARKAQQICQSLRFSSDNDRGEGTFVSCSIGAAVFPENGTTYEELFEKADRAVYRAKEQGKRQFVIYEEP